MDTKELIKTRSFRWICGGIGWPSPESVGHLCVIGSHYPRGFERPQYHLIVEVENADLKELCRNVLEFDFRYKPNSWFADKKNDAALAILEQINQDVKVVMPGKVYAAGDAPWHRRDIYVSQSAVFEMSNGLDYVLSILNDLLPERLILPQDSKILEQLRLIERFEKSTLLEHPAIAAIGCSVVESEEQAVSERRALLQSGGDEPDDWDRWND